MRADQVDRIMAIVEADAATSTTTVAIAPRSRRRYWVWGGGLATVAATAAALLLEVPHAARAPRGLVATAVAPAATVDFALNLATAKRVSVVGDFNHWDV